MTPVSVLQLPKLPGAAGKQHWGNLPGAALSLAIAEAASSAKRFTLLLTADSQSAERLQEELGFFAPDLPVLLGKITTRAGSRPCGNDDRG